MSSWACCFAVVKSVDDGYCFNPDSFSSSNSLAKDVAEWIEHTDVSMMLRTIDEGEKLVQTLFVSGQNREVLMLTEDG